MSEGKNLVHTLLVVLTGMVAWTITDSIIWTLLDALFFPVAWAKWLICHDVNMTVLHRTFDFFLR